MDTKKQKMGVLEQRYCPYCGSELVPAAAFCAHCGREMTAQTVNTTIEEGAELPKETTKKKWGSIVAVATILGFLLLFFTMFETEAPLVGTWKGQIGGIDSAVYDLEITLNENSTNSMKMYHRGKLVANGMGTWWEEGNRVYVHFMSIDNPAVHFAPIEGVGASDVIWFTRSSNKLYMGEALFKKIQ